MKFRVTWSPKAEQLLAAAWLNASDRDSISRAAQAIDRDLENHPFEVGESRESSRRILFALPLGVVYSIRRDEMLVRVLRVWHVSPKRP